MFDILFSSTLFLGCWVEIHPVLAFDGAAVLLTTLGHIARYKIHFGLLMCRMMYVAAG